MSENFGIPDPERMAGLIFELASQLHVERARRIALEAALVDAGVITPAAIEAAGAAARIETGLALDKAMHGLLRVIAEDSDPRTPLRKEGTRR
ncbi:hypothetical protein [Polymorphobacter sp.]|uniref:hypothetical protein n=1 Tax=Polymorphobacter sp. TaxID=1909290 RepID=UPI003F71A5B7